MNLINMSLMSISWTLVLICFIFVQKYYIYGTIYQNIISCFGISVNVDTLIWRELHTSGKVLPPRAGHSTVSFGKNLFVFGGVTSAQSLYNDLYMLDIGNLI